MGNATSCCVYTRRPGTSSSGSTPSSGHKVKKQQRRKNGHYVPTQIPGGNLRVTEEYHVSSNDPTVSGSVGVAGQREESVGNLQHISEREPDDWEEDPSLHPTTETMFMGKSKQSIQSKSIVPIIDLLGRPTVQNGSDHYFHACCTSVRPSPLFKISKAKEISCENSNCYWLGCGLSEGIIDDIHELSSNYLWIIQ